MKIFLRGVFYSNSELFEDCLLKSSIEKTVMYSKGETAQMFLPNSWTVTVFYLSICHLKCRFISQEIFAFSKTGKSEEKVRT